jgi:hypothetical protein
LFDQLVTAYVARGHAEKAGANAAALADGDDALEQIKSGRVVPGPDSWVKAQVAIRRFSEAFGAATRGGALGKKYGRTRRRPRRTTES